MTEPDIEMAKKWWPETPKKWTVLGWKDHVTRFNVLYDGTLVNYFSFNKGPQAGMAVTREAIPEPYCQFAFFPATSIDYVPAFSNTLPFDYGDVIQGWDDSDAPVLFSEWSWQGYLLRKQIFAHVPGGEELQTGNEPLFAWVRLSVHYKADGLPMDPNVGFGIRINAYTVNYAMELKHNLSNVYTDAKYPREIRTETESYSAGQGFRIVEPDGRVRLAVAVGEDCRAVFRTGAPSEQDSVLYVSLTPQEGAYVDLLIPMLPVDRDVFDKELALGYDEALKETEAFWSRVPDTAAVFDVPEDYINQAIRRNIQMNQMVAEKDPITGDSCILTGGLGYGLATWGTPVSIAMAGFLDLTGRHDLVKSYLKMFKDAQGEVTPPGDAFSKHPGYLGVPPRLAIVNWLGDHGSILWAMSQHGLLTGDTKFIEEYTPVIVRACEWIRDARRITGHGGVEGVMPPAGASDDESRVQVTWTDGWIYKGFSSAIRFLKSIDHPRAAEFEAEAADYRNTYQAAFRAKAETMPRWLGNQGNERILVPFALAKEQEWQYRHLFYLDTGPMHLVFAEIMDADDPLMQDAVAWYREGPPVKLYRPYGDLGHIPSLRYEMSSWEPCYSWNVFHSWKLGDRQHFLEGMYSQFAGAMSQQTYTVVEARGGVSGNVFWLSAMQLARLAVIDDQIEENELHLLRLCPLAWLRTDRDAKFENMPTAYGPVSLQVRLAENGNELQVVFGNNFRKRPGKIVLHIPPVNGLQRVMFNGRQIDWDGRAESVVLEQQ